jgi:hypothetical protein
MHGLARTAVSRARALAGSILERRVEDAQSREERGRRRS